MGYTGVGSYDGHCGKGSSGHGRCGLCFTCYISARYVLRYHEHIKKKKLKDMGGVQVSSSGGGRYTGGCYGGYSGALYEGSYDGGCSRDGAHSGGPYTGIGGSYDKGYTVEMLVHMEDVVQLVMKVHIVKVLALEVVVHILEEDLLEIVLKK